MDAFRPLSDYGTWEAGKIHVVVIIEELGLSFSFPFDDKFLTFEHRVSYGTSDQYPYCHTEGVHRERPTKGTSFLCGGSQ